MSHFLTTHNLKTAIAENAIATKLVYDKEQQRIAGCLYSAKGEKIPLSQRTSGMAGDRVHNSDEDYCDADTGIKTLTGNYIYMGHFMAHYGHFLTEGISSFWALKHFKGAIPVFHPFVFGVDVKEFMLPFFKAHDIDVDNIHIIREKTRFEHIAIPERTFHLNDTVHQEFISIIRHVKHALGIKKKEARKIFLSRARLENTGRAIENEKEIDIAMAQLGFEILHPQEISINKQIEIYASTHIMAGFSGSALHNCLFMDEGSVVIEMGDRRNPARPLLTQELCNAANKLNARYLPFTCLPGNANAYDVSALIRNISSITGSPLLRATA